MRRTKSLSITLPHDMAEMVRAKVSSGEYATESEVIRDGLRFLAARDAALERWLREEVVATYDVMKAGPEGTTESAAETWRQLQAHMDSKSTKATAMK
ncbi:type II toxin-antitoxin system ParD family antitoxin [Pleomorphomonas sp. JP5]|uniref:type II toxin-antitoxin system ParD family antitoxin n=1 Tax=Pleomorphomonas sp. JP5 TaxID=2942998 RepID=UPI0020440840|nr:type II toxin-antitoxin system ParD family antitoxin [Pleomorphomonas sp. JP5]MCM5557615.1 type II toxin-antitoxin system ParD family antitoxin [Pleomorphomonas sp. JP5]